MEKNKIIFYIKPVDILQKREYNNSAVIKLHLKRKSLEVNLPYAGCFETKDFLMKEVVWEK